MPQQRPPRRSAQWERCVFSARFIRSRIGTHFPIKLVPMCRWHDVHPRYAYSVHVFLKTYRATRARGDEGRMYVLYEVKIVIQ